MRNTDYAFAIWMMDKPHHGASVRHQEVMTYWRVSRATAFRWIGDFRDNLRRARLSQAMRSLHAA